MTIMVMLTQTMMTMKKLHVIGRRRTELTVVRPDIGRRNETDRTLKYNVERDQR
jgi:hypothetical protein